MRVWIAFTLWILAGVVHGYPTKPIRLVLGFPAGGGADSVARVFIPAMERALGQQIVIDYRPGAGTVIAAEYTAKAAPDGYTLHYVNEAALAMAPHLRKLAYEPLRSFTPISLIVAGGYVLAAHPAVPAADFSALVALARAKPDALTFASSGAGTAGHLAGELFKQATGTRILHVPYKGGAQAVADLIGGQVHLIFASTPIAVPQLRGGRIKAYGVTGPTRAPGLPEVPTLRELGLTEFEATVWFGLVGPAGLPADTVERVRGALHGALADPKVIEAIRFQGYDVKPTTQEAFAALIRADTVKWGEVIRGLKPEDLK